MTTEYYVRVDGPGKGKGIVAHVTWKQAIDAAELCFTTLKATSITIGLMQHYQPTTQTNEENKDNTNH